MAATRSLSGRSSGSSSWPRSATGSGISGARAGGLCSVGPPPAPRGGGPAHPPPPPAAACTAACRSGPPRDERRSGGVRAPENGVNSLLQPADAARQDHEDTPDEGGGPVEQLPEMRPIDDEQAQVGTRQDRGGARLAVEQAHLAEEVARLELAA